MNIENLCDSEKGERLILEEFCNNIVKDKEKAMQTVSNIHIGAGHQVPSLLTMAMVNAIIKAGL